MEKRTLIIIISFIAILFILAAYNYIFSIYETDFRVSATHLVADGNSQLTIIAIPLNGLGFRAPFRKVPTVYMVDEGNNLIEIIQNDEMHGILKIRAKLASGKVVISAKSKYALLPSLFEILILPNIA